MDRQRNVPALSFAILTPLYDAATGIAGYGASFVAKVLDAAGMRDGETLLDVGAGSGTLVVLAKRRFPASRVIGVEPDERILRRARAKAGRAGLAVEILQAGAESLPLADGSIDLAVSSLVFHHLPTAVKERAAAELFRVLRPGGRFLLADFGPPATVWMRGFVALVRALRLPEAATLQDNVAGRLPDLLRTAGFQVRETAPRYRGVRFLLASKPSPAAR